MFKDAENAFYDMLYPRSILKDSVRKMNVRETQKKHTNYPPMASERENPEDEFSDYRTAFKESRYNVRYSEWHIGNQSGNHIVSFLPIGLSTEDYLVQMGVLNAEDKGDQNAFQKACEEYHKVTGFVLNKERRYHVVEGEDMELYKSVSYMPDSLEGKRARMRQMVQGMANANSEAQASSRKQINNFGYTDHYEFKTWDQFDNHPKYRQAVLDIDTMYQGMQKKWANTKKLQLYKGSTKKWTVLDSSHSLESRTQLQSHIGDSRTVSDSLPEGQGSTEIALRRETLFVEDNENIEEIEYPKKTNYI